MRKNILFREHRGSLEASIKTQTKFYTLFEMLSYVSKIYKIDIRYINTKLYDCSFDNRIEWPNTYLLFVDSLVYNVELLGYFTILKGDNYE